MGLLPARPASPSNSSSPPVDKLPLLANGQYEVGCADIMLSEPSPTFSDSVTDSDGRGGVGVFARIFYPAEPSSSVSSALVLSTAPSTSSAAATAPPPTMRWRPDSEYIVGLANYQGFSVHKLNFFLDWIVGDKMSPVRWHASVAPGDQSFPLVIFSHGISGSRFVYTTLCASLASHGYVVAVMEHRDGSSCWTYSLEPVPTPPPSPPPSPPPPPALQPSSTVEGAQQQQNGVLPNAQVTQPNVVVDAPKQQPTAAAPSRTPTPPPSPTHVKKPIKMQILPHEETHYDIRIGQVKVRVAEMAQMRRIFAEMDDNGLQNVQKDNDEFGQQRQQILLGQTFDWAQFKNRLDLDRCVSMGHSFGAASALSACADHPSLFNVCVLLDPWLYPVERRVYPTTTQPVLLLNASKWQWARNVRRMQRLFTTTAPRKPPTETKAPPAQPQQQQEKEEDEVDTTTATTTTTTPLSTVPAETTVITTSEQQEEKDDLGTTVTTTTTTPPNTPPAEMPTTTTPTTPAQQEEKGKDAVTPTLGTSHINTDKRMMFTLKDIVHQSFSDFGFLVPGRFARYIGVQGNLDPKLTGTAIFEMMHNFMEAQFSQQQAEREEQEEDEEEDTDEEDDDGEEEEEEEDYVMGVGEAKDGEGTAADEEAKGDDGTTDAEKEAYVMGEANAEGATAQQDELLERNVSALDRLRRLVADKYSSFVLEGTDIPQATLDEVAALVEAEPQEQAKPETR